MESRGSVIDVVWVLMVEDTVPAVVESHPWEGQTDRQGGWNKVPTTGIAPLSSLSWRSRLLVRKRSVNQSITHSLKETLDF